MFILGIETATPWGSIALWEDGATLCEMSLKAQRGGGEFLLATLADWLPMTGRTLAELDCIAVGNGPGSYTGIRVGMAMANGLAEGLRIPVYGVNTLRIVAENAVCFPEPNLAGIGPPGADHGAMAGAGWEWVAAVIDARRDQVYAALYRNSAAGLAEEIPPQSVAATAFAQELAGRSVLLCGDGGKKYRELWTAFPNLRIAPPDWDRPQASRLARLAAQNAAADPKRTQPDGGTFDHPALKPAYLKKVEAVARWEEKCK